MRSLIKRLFRVLARALFRVRVGGSSEGLDAHARLLVIANHESFLDGLLLGLFLPLDPVFVVHTGVVRNLFFASAWHWSTILPSTRRVRWP